MARFPHLIFKGDVKGKPRFPQVPIPNPISKRNRVDRQTHFDNLTNSTSAVRTEWKQHIEMRELDSLAKLDPEIIPVFLQLSPSVLSRYTFDLAKFGLEIISEEEDGFIIGASLDDLQSLDSKIRSFLKKEHNSGTIADLWRIIDGNRADWKIKHVVSEGLFSKWNEITDESIYNVEVGIAFDKPLSAEPNRKVRGGEKRFEKYIKKREARDEYLMERETHFEKFIRTYGEITSSLIHLEDSFACSVEINGKGLKDLACNYPFVFEIVEEEEISTLEIHTESSVVGNIEIQAPDENAPVISIIDSGIMEQHIYLSGAIQTEKSISYVKDDESTVDNVAGGGHGTKVAGAVLYPRGISNSGASIQQPFYLRNLKVLGANNQLTTKFPAELIQRIVDENDDCSLFNLSVNSRAPFRVKHMSNWAATIDFNIFKKNKLFFISSGNISRNDISYFLDIGQHYPEYLKNPYCRISNPGQSCFALTVGSINISSFEDEYWKSVGVSSEISPFSRIGSGIWGSIKPDVVEYGGGLIKSKNSNSLREKEETSPELVRSTLNGGNAISKDSVGTSFATPKVAHIGAELLKMYPDENVNLIRALIIQGARLPNDKYINPTVEDIKFFGYGIPNLERITRNTKSRITFYTSSEISAEEAQVYSLKIPESITSQANEFDVLIEVTLAYSSKVRRTRQRTRSYLGTWLDWTSCHIEEPLETFKARTLKDINGEEIDKIESDRQVIQWSIRENKDWGLVKGISRNNSTAQKDWVIMKAFEMPSELCFAIRGHKGWDKNKEPIPYAFTVSIEALSGEVEIYENMRIENEIETPFEIEN